MPVGSGFVVLTGNNTGLDPASFLRAGRARPALEKIKYHFSLFLRYHVFIHRNAFINWIIQDPLVSIVKWDMKIHTCCLKFNILHVQQFVAKQLSILPCQYKLFSLTGLFVGLSSSLGTISIKKSNWSNFEIAIAMSFLYNKGYECAGLLSFYISSSDISKARM